MMVMSNSIAKDWKAEDELCAKAASSFVLQKGKQGIASFSSEAQKPWELDLSKVVTTHR